MAKEQAADIVESIRQALKNRGGGGSMPEQLFFVPKDGKKLIRFLSEYDEAIEIVMHSKFGSEESGGFMPQPCLKYYDKECPFHVRPFLTRTNYAWTIYEYDTKQKRVLIMPATPNSCIPDLAAIWDDRHTLKAFDVRIRREVINDKSFYKARDLEKAKFEGDYSKPFSKEKIIKLIEGLIRLEVIPKDKDEDDDRPRRKKDEDDEDRPRKRKEEEEDEDSKPKAKKPKVEEDEEE